MTSVTSADYSRHREELEALAQSLATTANSKVMSDEKFASAVAFLKGDITPTRNLRRWVKQHNFRLVNMPGAGIMDALVSDVKDPKDGSRFRRVVPQSNMYDVIHQVHMEELQHSGYKKVEAYVSIPLRFDYSKIPF